jgi:hypothetical protein
MKAIATLLGLTAPLIAFDLPPGSDLEQALHLRGRSPCFLIRAGSATGIRSESLHDVGRTVLRSHARLASQKWYDACIRLTFCQLDFTIRGR